MYSATFLFLFLGRNISILQHLDFPFWCVNICILQHFVFHFLGRKYLYSATFRPRTFLRCNKFWNVSFIGFHCLNCCYIHLSSLDPVKSLVQLDWEYKKECFCSCLLLYKYPGFLNCFIDILVSLKFFINIIDWISLYVSLVSWISW